MGQWVWQWVTELWRERKFQTVMLRASPSLPRPHLLARKRVWHAQSHFLAVHAQETNIFLATHILKNCWDIRIQMASVVRIVDLANTVW